MTEDDDEGTTSSAGTYSPPPEGYLDNAELGDLWGYWNSRSEHVPKLSDDVSDEERYGMYLDTFDTWIATTPHERIGKLRQRASLSGDLVRSGLGAVPTYQNFLMYLAEVKDVDISALTIADLDVLYKIEELEQQGIVAMAFGAATSVYCNAMASNPSIIDDAASVLDDMPIHPQKQQGHIRGTSAYNNRVKFGKATSTFYSEEQSIRLTQQAWAKGTPVGSQGNIRLYDFGRPIGNGPYGGYQTQVRVSINANGLIHGTPYGTVY